MIVVNDSGGVEYGFSTRTISPVEVAAGVDGEVVFPAGVGLVTVAAFFTGFVLVAAEGLDSVLLAVGFALAAT